MTMVTHNEDDILAQNLDFHLKQGVDFFFIISHNSTDGTKDILEEYHNRGVAWIDFKDSPAFLQAKWVTDMARKAATDYGADWIINNDSDELWMPVRGTLKEYFNSLPDDVFGISAPRYDFIFRPYAEGVFYQIMNVRENTHKWTKFCHRATPDIVVEEGNHFATSEGFRYKKNLSTNETPLKILHYPVRSYDRYRKNVEEKALAFSFNKEAPYGTNFHWKNAINKINEGKFDEHFQQFCLSTDQINANIKNGYHCVDDEVAKFFFNKVKNINRFQ